MFVAKIKRIYFAMPTASALRFQIEAALADRIPSALSPAPRIIRPVMPTGIQALDDLIDGGLPVGAITELAGPECSGRTSVAFSFLAQVTQAARVCAWIDVSDSFDPESAAAAGVGLSRLLWVRCGVSGKEVAHTAPTRVAIPDQYFVPPPTKKGLHGGGFGPHPRSEVKGLSEAVSGLLRPEAFAPRCAEPQRRVRPQRAAFEPQQTFASGLNARPVSPVKPWSRLEQALRVTDLILQGGGFSAIVLDMGGIAPEYVLRVPLATWFRYQAAAAHSQASLLLLTQHPCAKSSAGLVLRFDPGSGIEDEATVFTGVQHRVEAVRKRFSPSTTNVIPLRKPPQREEASSWQSRTPWAGRR
jgi:recombination protein RecA